MIVIQTPALCVPSPTEPFTCDLEKNACSETETTPRHEKHRWDEKYNKHRGRNPIGPERKKKKNLHATPQGAQRNSIKHNDQNDDATVKTRFSCVRL